MSEIRKEIDVENVDGIFDATTTASLVQNDVRESDARAVVVATVKVHDDARVSDSEIPIKKRKTRRGKSKRKNVHPYRKEDKLNVKAEAPYNSNRFLIEDHGELSIDEELKKTDQASTSTVTRTRDSSFSMDSDGEFYSTPDDEEVFLIKDFDDQYESLQAERLQAMSKDELVKEYLMLESKVEMLTKRLRGKAINGSILEQLGEKVHKSDVQREVQRLTIENDTLRRENESLRTILQSSSDSADSETDSSDSSSSNEPGASSIVQSPAQNCTSPNLTAATMNGPLNPDSCPSQSCSPSNPGFEFNPSSPAAPAAAAAAPNDGRPFSPTP